ncbi:phosphonate C-P lyase system protein PhnH [Roseibacterium beibuensis]|uniref:Phosphonate C-P lyase system protein PhnH n=1 Tax=[Roseibacterium] beibuensis TaxID=1193142 RepID=A0ABP9KVE6_9RHOB|nr:phosphonate C-P lyase system protein PhnH [Roseibacterium beibuensis]MCS6621990.1 phosphonate C-P lyase system protein PhnH [Roseibacterium beibuensis]
MQAQYLDGGFADPARDAAHAFRAALTALSRPGRIETLAGARPPAPASVAAGALLLTLCDATTGLYLAPSHDSDALRGWITFHTGAPFVGPEHAMFALGTWEALQPVTRFSVGTSEYPDRAATLIVEMDMLDNSGAVLTGPGIRDSARLSLPEVAAFRTNRRQFPLGFDSYFTCGDRVAGLPRSTRVEED